MCQRYDTNEHRAVGRREARRSGALGRGTAEPCTGEKQELRRSQRAVCTALQGSEPRSAGFLLAELTQAQTTHSAARPRTRTSEHDKEETSGFTLSFREDIPFPGYKHCLCSHWLAWTCPRYSALKVRHRNRPYMYPSSGRTRMVGDPISSSNSLALPAYLPLALGGATLSCQGNFWLF